MLRRVSVVALNTYREAVRARVLHGLFALAIATAGYAVLVGAFTGQNRMRAVSDLGAAWIALYGVIVAVVLGATSLYRELVLKTLFPILARPVRRTEYLVGKYLGTLLTLFVFIAAYSGGLLLAIAQMASDSARPWLVGLASVAAALVAAWRLPRWRTWLPLPWAIIIAVAGWLLAAGAPDDRRVIAASGLLTLGEVAIVTAIATVFASFSSPFLTAIFTFSLFVVGRSADTLAHLPARVFGTVVKQIGVVLSKVFPNLMLYVPPRPLLTGEATGVSLGEYLPMAMGHALFWSVGLLALASLIFRKRDFL
jgi:hypothetical protein